RFEVGEETRTDVAQADASRSAAIAQLAAARTQVDVSEANYRQIVGEEPGKLQSGRPLAKMLPNSLGAAIAIASDDHPAILAVELLVVLVALWLGLPIGLRRFHTRRLRRLCAA